MKTTDWNKHWHWAPRSLLEFAEKLFWHGLYRPLLRGTRLKEPRILELGAGTGVNSGNLLRLYGGRATLIDNNADIRRHALAGLSGLPVSYVLADFWKWKPKGNFDLVHSEGLVEHFHGQKRQRIFDLHARWLRPGGLAVITAPNPCIAYSLFRTSLKALGRWIYTDEVPLTRKELIRRATAAGLTVLGSAKPFWSVEAGILCRKEA